MIILRFVVNLRLVQSTCRIDQATIDRLSAQVAKAYEETGKQDKDLRRAGKLPMDPSSRRVGQRRELSAARIEADANQSTMKDEQLLKLIETFMVPANIKFHVPIPSCSPSQLPPGWLLCAWIALMLV